MDFRDWLNMPPREEAEFTEKPNLVHVYRLTAPIDFWPAWRPQSEVVEHLAHCLLADQVSKLYNFVEAAKQLAKKIGWDLDIREGVYVAALAPSEPCDDFSYMVAWKQENNGETFLASPGRIPWLDRDTEHIVGHWELSVKVGEPEV